ncbi:hypothetical protein HZC08_02105, partial [Candidatus Micrarchaeota archaeon]|nr:hypothetical protein [Candidatus Micrarchaeota archaeon]
VGTRGQSSMQTARDNTQPQRETLESILDMEPENLPELINIAHKLGLNGYPIPAAIDALTDYLEKTAVNELTADSDRKRIRNALSLIGQNEDGYGSKKLAMSRRKIGDSETLKWIDSYLIPINATTRVNRELNVEIGGLSDEPIVLNWVRAGVAARMFLTRTTEGEGAAEKIIRDDISGLSANTFRARGYTGAELDNGYL